MNDDAEFQTLFSATYPSIVRYARHRGLAGQDLEDVVAATFEVAWRRFDAVPDGDGALPWLIGVARNHIRNHRRRTKRDRGLLERLPAPPPAAGPAVGGTSWRDIRRALDALPEADRELILLVAWDELTPAQAARTLGISPGAARTRLHRARNRLAEHLDPMTGSPEAVGPTSPRRLNA